MATDPAVANTPQSHVQRAWAGLLRHAGAGLLVLTVGLAVLAWSTWQLRCENFGCIYRGLVWVVWAVLAGVGLVAALAVRAWQRRRGFSTRASGLALVLLLAMGVGHLLYWLLTTVLK
jgi:hypothetical protein